MNKKNTTYDLEERTSKFGEKIINFCKGLQQDSISKPLISQLVRSATSIGANYMEANGASSKKDFTNKINIVKREAKETQYWLRMIKRLFSDKENEIRDLWKECREFVLIFAKISSTLKRNKNSENY